jgi:hypothetical protein
MCLRSNLHYTVSTPVDLMNNSTHLLVLQTHICFHPLAMLIRCPRILSILLIFQTSASTSSSLVRCKLSLRSTIGSICSYPSSRTSYSQRKRQRCPLSTALKILRGDLLVSTLKKLSNELVLTKNHLVITKFNETLSIL